MVVLEIFSSFTVTARVMLMHVRPDPAGGERATFGALQLRHGHSSAAQAAYVMALMATLPCALTAAAILSTTAKDAASFAST